jgi:hypothetical protein
MAHPTVKTADHPKMDPFRPNRSAVNAWMMAPKKVPAERRDVTLKDKKGDVNNRTRTKMFMGLFRTDGLPICAEDIAGLSDLSVMHISTRPEKKDPEVEWAHG